MDINPLKIVKTYNENIDRERVRRALTPDEISRLLTVTENPEYWNNGNEKVHHGLTGRQRGLLYRFALETGFRWSEN